MEEVEEHEHYWEHMEELTFDFVYPSYSQYFLTWKHMSQALAQEKET